MSRHESCTSHVSTKSISASPSSKPICVISSVQSSLFQDIMNNINLEIDILMFNNLLPFRTCESRYMDDIIQEKKQVPGDNNIPQGRGSMGQSLMHAMPPRGRDKQGTYLPKTSFLAYQCQVLGQQKNLIRGYKLVHQVFGGKSITGIPFSANYRCVQVLQEVQPHHYD